jgi:excisionase family DNA binding protein
MTTPHASTGLYTLQDLAALTQTSVRHLQRLDARNAIPGRVKIGRLVRFSAPRVHAWLKLTVPAPSQR